MEAFESPTWEEDCIKTYGEVLSGSYAHWCREWDDLPIDETCPEFEVCLCYKIGEDIQC